MQFLTHSIRGSWAKHTTVRDFYRLAQDTTTKQGLEMSRQLLLELGNRRESKDAKELKAIKAALVKAGLTLYKSKIISVAEAQKLQQAERITAKTLRPKPLPKPMQRTIKW